MKKSDRTLFVVVWSLFRTTDSFVRPGFVRKINSVKYRHLCLNRYEIVKRHASIVSVHQNAEEEEANHQDQHHYTSCQTILTDYQSEQSHELCDDLDKTMEGLVSPSPESFYVLNSAISKINEEIDYFNGNMPGINAARGHAELRALSWFLLKPDYSIELYLDTERLKWRLIPRTGCKSSVVSAMDCIQKGKSELYHEYNILQLSRMALDLATKTPSDPQNLCKIHEIARQAQKRLALTMGSDLRGPTSSDAAFNFALAGVHHSSSLFQSLSCMGNHELKRSGLRASFPPKNILRMVEKFAACDIHGQQALDLYHTAGVCLESKGYNDARLLKSLRDGSFGFHCDRPLLWLWRFSSRQTKVSESLPKSKDRRRVNWGDIFYDTSKPLVCDIGSGMGASILNLSILASIDDRAHDNSDSDDDVLEVAWSQCNYVGADLNRSMINFGNGIISRDSARRIGRVHFLCLSAEEFLTELQFYPGGISLIMINFPTPYRLGGSGNSQLPPKHSNQFMATRKTLASIAELLDCEEVGGLFLFQTKCEDVAVYVKNECSSFGTMECIPCQNPVRDIDLLYNKIGKRPKRVDEWLKVAPYAERADGCMYSRTPLLPTAGRPETEIQCSHDNKVVHRFLFQKKLGSL